MNPKALRWIAISILLLAVLVSLLWYALTPSVTSPVVSSPVVDPRAIAASRPPPEAQTRLPGERLFENYRSAQSTPEEDLTQVGRLIENFRVLVKDPDALPLGSNEEMVAAFLGRNPAHQPFLRSNHPAINAQGQLMDRWGSPLFFHVRSAREIDIRSAGPDRVLWTEDDLQRDQNGTFERGVSKGGAPRR